MVHFKTVGHRLLHFLQTAEAIVCACGLSLTTLLIFAQVINRKWVHLEVMWLGDMGLYCFIFFMFVAAALATWRETHISVDAFRDKLFHTPKARAIHKVLLMALSMVILSVFMPVAYHFTLRALRYPEYGTIVRWFNHSWLMETMFFSLILVFIHLIVIAVRDIKHLTEVLRAGGPK